MGQEEIRLQTRKQKQKDERENRDQNLERSTCSTRSPDVLFICPTQQIKAILSSLFSVYVFTVRFTWKLQPQD